MMIVRFAGKPSVIVDGTAVRGYGETSTRAQLQAQGVPVVTAENEAEYARLTKPF